MRIHHSSRPNLETQATFFPEAPASRRELPATTKQVRPTDRRHGPQPIMVEGEPLDVVESCNEHWPGIGPTKRRIIDLVRGKFVVARVTTYTDGPRCFCQGPDIPLSECPHILALVLAGAFPELRHLPTWALANMPEGGAW